MDQSTPNQNTRFSAFMLIISLTFYLFFACFDGAVICVDSPDYLEMNLTREPLYPMFLSFFRALFNDTSSDSYLFAVVIVQSILAAAAAWSMAAFLSREFPLGRFFSLLILGIPMMVSLLCRFAARRSSMYSNSILTEGLTIPCFLLFFRFLFSYVFRHSKRDLFTCAFLSFVMISTRKQMLFSLLLLLLCILYVSVTEKRIRQGITAALACFLGILLCSTCLDAGYNYVLRGSAVRHFGDTRFITTMAFYTAAREDSRYIEDRETRELFLEIYDICDEAGYLKSSAKEGWANRVSHFGDHYDLIQIDTMWPRINAYAREHYGEDAVAVNVQTDLIMKTINASVIPHNLTKIAATFGDNFLSGLITTAAQRTPFLTGYSLFLYLLYLLLLIYHISHGRNQRLCVIAVLSLLSTLLNVGLVSLVIFCQTRYTIYNMPLLYSSLLLMLYEPARRLIKNRRHTDSL